MPLGIPDVSLSSIENRRIEDRLLLLWAFRVQMEGPGPQLLFASSLSKKNREEGGAMDSHETDQRLVIVNLSCQLEIKNLPGKWVCPWDVILVTLI